MHQQLVAHVFQHVVFRFVGSNQPGYFAFRIFQVFVSQRTAGSAFRPVDQQEAFVFGGLGAEVQQRLGFIFVDQFIGGLRCTNFVVINLVVFVFIRKGFVGLGAS